MFSIMKELCSHMDGPCYIYTLKSLFPFMSPWSVDHHQLYNRRLWNTSVDEIGFFWTNALWGWEPNAPMVHGPRLTRHALSKLCSLLYPRHNSQHLKHKFILNTLTQYDVSMAEYNWGCNHSHWGRKVNNMAINTFFHIYCKYSINQYMADITFVGWPT